MYGYKNILQEQKVTLNNLFTVYNSKKVKNSKIKAKNTQYCHRKNYDYDQKEKSNKIKI